MVIKSENVPTRFGLSPSQNITKCAFLDNGQIMKADQMYMETSFHRKQNIKFFKK